MTEKMNNQSNIDRFSGFADTYDRYRPAAPGIVAEVVRLYLGKMPATVVDIGCGTGLSTLLWREVAAAVVGIEPNGDMRAVAQSKAAECKNVRFIKGYSNATGLAAQSVDVVTISQAFHWMDHDTTLTEAARILKPGGILAVYDCDWPPVLDWQIEKEYHRLHSLCNEISLRATPSVDRKDKSKHLAAIQGCGLFSYVRELVFHHAEPMDADRMAGILLSQGGIQAALTADERVKPELERFAAFVRERMGTQTTMALFSYRMRLGIR